MGPRAGLETAAIRKFPAPTGNRALVFEPIYYSPNNKVHVEILSDSVLSTA